MPTERTVSTDCSSMCRLLDGPARKREMPSICICGKGAICGYTPLSDEVLNGIEEFLAGKVTSINVNTARELLDEVKWLRARLAVAADDRENLARQLTTHIEAHRNCFNDDD